VVKLLAGIYLKFMVRVKKKNITHEHVLLDKVGCICLISWKFQGNFFFFLYYKCSIDGHGILNCIRHRA